MKEKKIAAMLAAGLVMGTMFASPVAAPVAEAANESVLKLKSPAETYAAQGEKLFNEGRFTEAGDAYKKAAEEAENNDEYWYLCGLSYFRAKSYGTASEPLKKALKLKRNEGIYNYFYGLSLWNWAGAIRSGQSSSLLSGTDDLMDKGDQYVKRAAELMPDDANVQTTAGTIAENYANYLARSGGYRSYINEEYQRAYQHFRRAAEIDPSKGENQTRFANEHPEYGFQPYGSVQSTTNPVAGTQGATGTGAQGANSSAAELNKPSRLKENAAKLQDLMKNGKMKLYNAGAGFEWWDEEAKADFEALPFSDDIEEVASHVYQVIWDDRTPYASYVVLVPRHVHVTYGPGEEKSYDTLLIVEIAGTEEVGNGALRLTPYTEMVDRYYLKNGRTHEIVHLASHLTDEESFSWKWLEEGRQEVEVQQASSIPMLGEETIYKFEGTNDPNVFIVHGRVGEEYDGEPQNNFYVAEDAVSAPDTWTGKMVALPDIVVPPVAGYGAE